MTFEDEESQNRFLIENTEHRLHSSLCEYVRDCEDYTNRRSEAILRLQRVGKCYVAKKEVHHIQRSIVVLQSWCRCKVAIITAPLSLRYKSATYIQRVWRLFSVTSQHRSFLNEIAVVAANERLEILRNSSSVRIQRLYRRYQHQVIKSYKRRVDAVKLIEVWWRRSLIQRSRRWMIGIHNRKCIADEFTLNCIQLASTVDYDSDHHSSSESAHSYLTPVTSPTAKQLSDNWIECGIDGYLQLLQSVGILQKVFSGYLSRRRVADIRCFRLLEHEEVRARIEINKVYLNESDCVILRKYSTTVPTRCGLKLLRLKEALQYANYSSQLCNFYRREKINVIHDINKTH